MELTPFTNQKTKNLRVTKWQSWLSTNPGGSDSQCSTLCYALCQWAMASMMLQE